MVMAGSSKPPSRTSISSLLCVIAKSLDAGGQVGLIFIVKTGPLRSSASNAKVGLNVEVVVVKRNIPHIDSCAKWQGVFTLAIGTGKVLLDLELQAF